MAKKRMFLSLDKELYDILMKLSEVSGVSASGFVAEMLQTAKPRLLELIETFKLVQEKPGEALDKLKETVANTQQDVKKAEIDLTNIKRRRTPKKGKP